MSGRTEASWTTVPTTADMLIFQNWRTIVARAREAAHENDYARKFLQLVRDNTVGPKGFQLLARIMEVDQFGHVAFDPITKNPKPDRFASDAIEDAYKDFSRRGNFETTGTMSRADVEALIATTWATDGEAIIVATYGKSAGPWGFAWQMRDATLLDPMHNEARPNGNIIRAGIEYDPKTWRPIAYWFRARDAQLLDYVETFGARYEVIPAQDVIHVFRPEMVGQKRGLSQLRTALWRFRQLKGFQDAATINARIGAAKMGFFRDSEAEDDENDELPMDAEPGVFENIGNRDFVQWNPQFPEKQVGPFTADLLRGAASGLCVSYANLSSDLTGVNYSSIRQGALDERESWKGIQEWMIACAVRTMFDTWLGYALLFGRITVNGKSLPFEKIEKFRRVEFQGRRWSWIDPSSEMAAHEKSIALKLESRSSVIRESGRDPDDVFREIAEETDDMKAAGIDPTVNQPGAAASPGTSEPSNAPAAEGDNSPNNQDEQE